MKKLNLLIILLINYFGIGAQNRQNINLFKDIIIQTDSGNYSKSVNNINVNYENCIWFYYYSEDEVCHVILYPDQLIRFKSLALQETSDYEIIDSIRFYNNLYYDFKIRFNNLTKSDFLKFSIIYKKDTGGLFYDIKLFPLYKTTALIDVNSNELTVGEEKVIELITNNAENIRLNPDWDNSRI